MLRQFDEWLNRLEKTASAFSDWRPRTRAQKLALLFTLPTLSVKNYWSKLTGKARREQHIDACGMTEFGDWICYSYQETGGTAHVDEAWIAPNGLFEESFVIKNPPESVCSASSDILVKKLR